MMQHKRALCLHHIIMSYFMIFFFLVVSKGILPQEMSATRIRDASEYEDLVIHHEPQRPKVDRHQSAAERIFSCFQQLDNEMFFQKAPFTQHLFQCRRKRIVEEAPCGGHTGRNRPCRSFLSWIRCCLLCQTFMRRIASSTSSLPTTSRK